MSIAHLFYNCYRKPFTSFAAAQSTILQCTSCHWNRLSSSSDLFAILIENFPSIKQSLRVDDVLALPVSHCDNHIAKNNEK